MDAPQTTSSNTPRNLTFFQALEAPYVPTLLIENEPGRPLHRRNLPRVPLGKEPLALPIFEATGDWEWLNGHTIHDIHDAAILHENADYRITLRTCRAGDRGFAYINKSWILRPSRNYGVISELWLYKNTLKNLMGTTVPRLIAVRSAPNRLNLGFELQHQTFFIEASADMPNTLKRRVIRALEKLHSKGICTNSTRLRNILIGGDGKIIISNFHQARCTTENKDVHLEQAKPSHFRWEMRRLKFKLDYEGAREKEKAMLAKDVERKRRNKLEERKSRNDPFYNPQYEERGDAITLNPPLDLQMHENWLDELDREPRRYIVPGQSLEDFEWELKRFYNILQKMEDNDIDDKLVGRPQVQPPMPSPAVPSTIEQRLSVESKIKQESATPSPQSFTFGKRKRSPDPSPSAPTKRFRPEHQPSVTLSTVPDTNTVEKFKHDRLKAEFKLVAGSRLHASIQENNLIQDLPFIIARDSINMPRPIRSEGVGKRLRQEYADEEERATKRRKLDEEGGWSSWMASWNPLQFLFSSDVGPMPPISLRKRRLFQSNNQHRHMRGVAHKALFRLSNGASLLSSTDSVFRFEFTVTPGDVFPSAHSLVSGPLRSIARVFDEIVRPMS